VIIRTERNVPFLGKLYGHEYKFTNSILLNPFFYQLACHTKYFMESVRPFMQIE